MTDVDEIIKKSLSGVYGQFWTLVDIDSGEAHGPYTSLEEAQAVQRKKKRGKIMKVAQLPDAMSVVPERNA